MTAATGLSAQPNMSCVFTHGQRRCVQSYQLFVLPTEEPAALTGGFAVQVVTI